MSSLQKYHLLLHCSTLKTMNIGHKSIVGARNPVNLWVNELQWRGTTPYIIPKRIKAPSPISNITNREKEFLRMRMNIYNPEPCGPRCPTPTSNPLFHRNHLLPRGPLLPPNCHNQFRKRDIQPAQLLNEQIALRKRATNII